MNYGEENREIVPFQVIIQEVNENLTWISASFNLNDLNTYLPHLINADFLVQRQHALCRQVVC